MTWSHSKLNTIVDNPMAYYLSYIQGIHLKEKPKALSIGSAIHWGLEHNTEDLTEYYNNEGNFKQKDNYDDEQILAESMVHGFLKNKENIFDKILRDYDGNKLELLNESHELSLIGKLKSKLSDTQFNEFLGIIDLLLITNKGFIVLDYKTSSMEPNWDDYLDQIYRYIFLLKENFPDIPVYKIGIINLRKTAIRKKKIENDEQFKNRIKFEYEMNDDNYINYHEYNPEELDSNLINNYIDNLAKECDFALNIDNTKSYFINFANAKGKYGKSEYYDIYYNTPNNYLLYTIKDYIWNEDNEEFVTERDCVAIDMTTINHTDDDLILNKYEKFKELYEDKVKYMESECFMSYSLEDFIDSIKKEYICDDFLLEIYKKTYEKENF